MATFPHVDSKKITNKERNDTLTSLLFLTKKMNRDIKVRGCTDLRKQRYFLTDLMDMIDPETCSRKHLTLKLQPPPVWHSGQLNL